MSRKEVREVLRRERQTRRQNKSARRRRTKEKLSAWVKAHKIAVIIMSTLLFFLIASVIYFFYMTPCGAIMNEFDDYEKTFGLFQTSVIDYCAYQTDLRDGLKFNIAEFEISNFYDERKIRLAPMIGYRKSLIWEFDFSKEFFDTTWHSCFGDYSIKQIGEYLVLTGERLRNQPSPVSDNYNTQPFTFDLYELFNNASDLKWAIPKDEQIGYSLPGASSEYVIELFVLDELPEDYILTYTAGTEEEVTLTAPEIRAMLAAVE